MSAKPEPAAPQTRRFGPGRRPGHRGLWRRRPGGREGADRRERLLEAQLDALRSKISTGYARGRLPSAHDRKE